MDSSEEYVSEDERTSSNEPSQKKLKVSTESKIYKKKVTKSLLAADEFKEWLDLDKDGKTGKCKVCCTALKGGKSELIRHSKTKLHQKNIHAKNIQPSVIKFVPQNDKLKQLENSMCCFLVENDLPISFVEPLSEFCKSLPEKNVVEKLQLGKQKATNIIRQGLRPFFNNDLAKQLQNVYFSLFIDETTDITTKSQLAIVVSYYCLIDYSTKVDVIDVVQMEDGTAQGIFDKMISVLDENKIPLNNWVGFSADTTAVMMGPHQSVAQLISKNHPGVIVVKCSCHSIHLVASYACKKLPSSLEDLVRTVYSHFKKSPKRSAALIDFQKFFDSETSPKKMLAPGQTRWLSLQNCVRRILEFWKSLENYWAVVVFEDKTHANDQVLATLRNPLLKALMEFAEYGLSLLNDFNTFFQCDAPQFGLLKSKVNELLKTLALNFMIPEYVRQAEMLEIDPLSSDHYLPLKQVYLGVQAHQTVLEVTNANPQEVEKLFKGAQEFYIESMVQIKNRFQFTDSDHFSDAEFLIPDNARNLVPPSLFSLANKYSKLKPDLKINVTVLDKEWRNQSVIENKENDMHEYWKTLFSASDCGIRKFPELSKIVSIFFSLPFSNAATERVFSCLKNVKSDKRNRLDNETLSALLCVKYGIKRTNKNSAHLMKNKIESGRSLVISSATASHSKSIRVGTNVHSSPSASASTSNP